MSDSKVRITFIVGITGLIGWGFYELALAVGNSGIKAPLLVLSAIMYLMGLAFSLFYLIYFIKLLIYFIKKMFHQS